MFVNQQMRIQYGDSGILHFAVDLWNKLFCQMYNENYFDCVLEQQDDDDKVKLEDCQKNREHLYIKIEYKIISTTTIHAVWVNKD